MELLSFSDFDAEGLENINNINFLELQNNFLNSQSTREFREISNEYALNTPFGKNSLLYKEAKGEFYTGYTDFMAVLYHIGAAMAIITDFEEKNQLDDVIVIANNEKSIFDYKKFINGSPNVENSWEFQDTEYTGKAILNKKIAYIDTEKVFLSDEGLGYAPYCLYFPYRNDGNISLNNPNIEYLKENAAIKLSDLSWDSLLIILSNLHQKQQKLYIEKIFKDVARKLEDGLISNPLALHVLYDLPIFLLKFFKNSTIEYFLFGLLSDNILPNAREQIVLKLLETCTEKESFNATSFLNKLLTTHINGQNAFLTIYDKMNDWGGGNNFSQAMILLAKIWSESIYIDSGNKVFNDYDIPIPLAYTQDYILGFRLDNFDFEMSGSDITITTATEIPLLEDTYTHYHVFQPVDLIALKEVQNEDLILAEGVKIPAFYLKAFDDKGAWENFEKALWITADFISLYTGVGALLQLRRIAQTAEITFVVLRTTFGILQVSSSVISIGLSLIENSKNRDLVNKLREYLFWFELCILGTDALSTRILRKKAADLETVLEKNRNSLNKKELLDVNNFSEHLDDIIELERQAINTWDGGKFIGERLLRKRIKNLLHDYKNFNLEIHIVDEVKDAERIVKWNARKVLGSFSMGPPPKIYFRKQITELTWQHELWHLEDLKKMGAKKFYSIDQWKHEELVWDRIWQSKNRWTENELVDSYQYYKKIALLETGRFKAVKEMEDLLSLPYYKFSRYKQ
ncbi:zincin-like metallopeptidase toxin domain-containing protein [Flavobacterium silvaticum]|uniref:Tox-MPTase4 domain-containing protein n=1 Tax=Flavobacterium silvaticum TaxID=1852020 RepID=A0A972FMK6_9FLAO|nr:zincin-like metallopeptidase toxin domain-containing protein [Flavobacterium silvaticum]NMH28442.1 hypothetical protein [Flavobacterium silvaticum]